MAGSYPDAPSQRIAWDADGSMAWYATQGASDTMNVIGAATTANMNNEYGNDGIDFGYNEPARYIYVQFPEPMDLDGVFHAYHEYNGTVGVGGQPGTFHTSVDAVNGRDGTWVQQVADLPDHAWPETATYRDQIQTLSVTSVKATRNEVKLAGSSAYQGVNALHFYGKPSAGGATERILFLDPASADAEFDCFEYDDIPQRATLNKTIKLKNNSATKVATTVQITAEDLHGGAGAWFTFSDDDITYTATLNITSIATSSTQLVYVRQIIPATGKAMIHAPRFTVGIGSWV